MSDRGFSLEEGTSAASGQAEALPVVDRLLSKLREDAIKAERLWKGVHGSSSSEMTSKYAGAASQRFLLRYERWLNERLEGSGLAQLIPAGIDALPDIFSRMPEGLRRIEELRRPRTPEELLEHLYTYLDCYLDPARRPATPNSILLMFVVLALLGGALALSIAVSVESGLVMLAIMAVLALRLSPLLAANAYNGERRLANIVCLEWYLRHVYGDPDQELEAQEVDVDWN